MLLMISPHPLFYLLLFCPIFYFFVSQVTDPWECPQLVALNRKKPDDIPYHAAITALR
jgi:hypothetical protein